MVLGSRWLIGRFGGREVRPCALLKDSILRSGDERSCIWQTVLVNRLRKRAGLLEVHENQVAAALNAELFQQI